MNGLKIAVFAIVAGLGSWAATPAFACSPPFDPVSVLLPTTGISTWIAFDVSGDFNPEDVRATLVGVDSEIAGEVEHASHIIDGNVFLFRPDAPAPPGSYTFTVAVSSELTSDPGNEFIGQVEVREPADPTIGVELSGYISEDWKDAVCCVADSDLGDCGGGSCWPSGYEYARELHVGVTTDIPVHAQAVVVSPLDSDGLRSGGSGVVIGSRNLRTTSTNLDAHETCIELTVSTLEGDELTKETHCLAAEDFPEVQKREVDEPDAVTACVEPPDDENDPNWQKYGDDSPAGKSGGCNTSGHSPMSPVLLLLAAILLGRRRPTRSVLHGQS
jgi:uncharacterized protein (TIGR03382 family)